MYYKINKVYFLEIENTHTNSSKPIRTIAVLPNAIECIKGCELIEANEIIINNYRVYIVNFNLKRYFKEQMSP